MAGRVKINLLTNKIPQGGGGKGGYRFSKGQKRKKQLAENIDRRAWHGGLDRTSPLQKARGSINSIHYDIRHNNRQRNPWSSNPYLPESRKSFFKDMDRFGKKRKEIQKIIKRDNY